jgi:hypothetical protein
MVTMLVVDSRTINFQLYVHAVTFMTVSEQLASDGDRGWEGVLGIMNASGLGKRSGRQFTEVDLLRRVGSVFSDHKVRSVAALTLFDVEGGSELWPHLLLPFKVILFHSLVVIALTPGTQSDGTKLTELGVDLLGNHIVVFIRSVAEAEDDVFDAIEAMLAFGEGKVTVFEVLHELYGVVCRLALAISGHDEHNSAVFRNGIKVFEFIFFRIAY